MTIPPKYEDVVAQLEAALEREASLREEVIDLEYWRVLALQFDNHRMKAIWHLKTLVSDGAHYDEAASFLTEQPITATELQQRLTVAEQALSQVEGACDLAMSAIDADDRGANFVNIIQAIKDKAALKPATGRGGCGSGKPVPPSKPVAPPIRRIVNEQVINKAEIEAHTTRSWKP